MVNANEGYFEEVRLFILDLEKSGHKEEAKIVREGFKCINGLTDGWALHLESLLKVEAANQSNLNLSQKQQLTYLCNAAYEAVYKKRRRKRWWKFW